MISEKNTCLLNLVANNSYAARPQKDNKRIPVEVLSKEPAPKEQDSSFSIGLYQQEENNRRQIVKTLFASHRRTAQAWKNLRQNSLNRT